MNWPSDFPSKHDTRPTICDGRVPCGDDSGKWCRVRPKRGGGVHGPYCAKLAGPCPDGCPTVQLTGCGGGTAGDCWRVKQPTVAGGPQ